MMKKKLFVLDVSGYIFRAYYALPAMKSPKGEPTHALYGFIRSVMKLYKEFSPDNLVAVFDGPDNKKQRLEIYEKYKMNRIRSLPDLPEQIEKAKVFCDLVGIDHLEIPGVEADDTIGSVAKLAQQKGWEVYILTSDKDLAQLVGDDIYLINPWKENLLIDRKKVEELYGVAPEQMVDLLAIMGDPSDNIPGIRGLGPKTTVPLLKQYGTLENLIAHANELTGKKQELILTGKEEANLSKRLATIHTEIHITTDESFFAKKEPDQAKLVQFYMDNGFNSLVREMGEATGGGKEEKDLAYHLVDDEKALDQLIEKLSREREICFDVEATHLRPLLARAVGIGFAIKPKEAFYVPLNGKIGREKVLSCLKPLFENPKIGFFGHNAKYDLHVLENEKIFVANISFDTILASYLLNSSSRRHSLDHLSLQYFGKIKIPIKSLIGTGKKEITMMEVPIDKVTTYCCEDVDYTVRLKEILSAEIKERKLSSLLFDVELPLMRVLARMERQGVYLDLPVLEKMRKKVIEDIDSVESEIYAMAGEKFNIASHQQLSKILFEKLKIKPLKKTATGLSTRADVLEELATENPIAQKIIDYRTLEKLRSTYLDVLPSEINPDTQRVHPTFNQSVAATGRLSCQDPNLQNIPVRTSQGRQIREAFRPQKNGWSYLAADYSQMELRLLAHLSGDEHLIKAFNAGEDIHAYTASLVFNVPLDKVSEEERNRAKAINFGIVYGQQAYGLSQEIGIAIHEASQFIEAYFSRYPKVLAFINECIDKAKKSGKSTTLIGRERDIPEISSSNATLRMAAERLAINTPLQGSAADIIKIAMIEIDKLLKENAMESYMVLQIHDELIFETPDNEIDKLSSLVKKIMEGVVSFKVPLAVNLTVGKNWSEC